MKEAQKQLAEWDKELDRLRGRNGDLCLEVQNLTEQLKNERADREQLEVELSELKQNFSPTATLAEKLTPDLDRILSQIRGKRQKLTIINRQDLKLILQILESSSNKIEEE